MENYRFISEIMGGVWLINPDFARQQMPLIKSLLKGKGKRAEKPLPPLSTFSAGSLTIQQGFASSEIQEGSIAIINISGPITKTGGWCSYGTQHFSQWLSQAEANPNIAGILFKVDTPGGTVGGTGSFAQQIDDCSKPTLGFIDDGMCCSAGFWMMAPCDQIISSHATNSVGSIGVFVSLWKKIKSEEDSYEILEIYADQSSEKNKPYKEALKGNDKIIKEEQLNPLAQHFIDAIKKYRGDKISTEDKKIFQGKVYLSEEAQEKGLIDGIGNMDFALQQLQQLIDQQKNDTTENSNFNSQTIMSLPKNKPTLMECLKTLIHSEETATATGNTAPDAAAQLQELEQELNTLKATHSQLEAQLKETKDQKATLETENQQLTQQLEDMTASRDEWQQTAATYGAKPAGDPSKVAAAGDDKAAHAPEEELSEDQKAAMAYMKEQYGATE